MPHFLITFRATINGSHTETGLVGSSTPDSDHRPNTVKRTIEEHFRKKFPTAKQVAVVLLDIKPVTQEEYYSASKDFIGN